MRGRAFDFFGRRAAEFITIKFFELKSNYSIKLQFVAKNDKCQ